VKRIAYNNPIEETKDTSANFRRQRMRPSNDNLDPISQTNSIFDENQEYVSPVKTSYYKEDDPITNYGDLGDNIETLVHGLVQRRKEEERRLKEQQENGCQVS